VFFQPHSAPGVYARAFLEGRLSEEQLANHYRQELAARRPVLLSASLADAGVLAVSDRLDGHRADQRDLSGALHALSEHRGLADTGPSAASGACSATARWTSRSRSRADARRARGLDNLTFIINCNLQRLDGPVRGNGQIIQELESLFAGAGWNVIKVLWGSEWDVLFARDATTRCCANFRRDRRRQIPEARRQRRRLQPRISSRRTRSARAGRAHVGARDRRLEARRPRFRKLYAAFAAGAGTRDSRPSSSPRPRRATAWAARASRG
jgi:pyruvate dehydrogenase E1 component